MAQRRRLEASVLCRLVRGDLDWIAMEALEKDRRRRYATANDLADDVERHLRHELVLAGPPGGLYRARRVLRAGCVT